jgi:Mg2+ and Co2+ transporter CorA
VSNNAQKTWLSVTLEASTGQSSTSTTTVVLRGTACLSSLANVLLLLVQVASLFVWFSTVAGFYGLEVPMLPSVAWQATTAALYSIATVAVFCAYFKVR